MKRYIDFLFLFSFIFFLTACRGDEEWTMINSGFLISLGDEQANITSRATPAEIGKPVADQFQLRIIKNETDNVIYNGMYKSGIIQASTGIYTLTAFCGDNPELAWDTPYYEGTTQAEVKSDQTTSVTIPCKVANALLSIQFSNPEKFATIYSSYGVKVTVGGSSLNFENSDTKKSAYFRAGSKVTLTFHATMQENGKEVSMVIENDNLPQTFVAGTHTKLSLTAATPTSGTILEVDKVEIEKVTVNQTIPLEWLPKPKVTGLGGNTVLNYTETADAPSEAVISYTASSPVQDVEFTLDFKDPQYSGYNKTYILSALTDEERSTLSNIGIKLPKLDNISKEGQFDLSALTANLMTDNGTEVTNTLKFKVKANNRWSSEDGEDFQIKVMEPEFTTVIEPQDIWAKEFTISRINALTGNAKKIESNLSYQYSADGGITWQNCNYGNIQKFASLPEIKKYKVRAIYRGAINSKNSDIELESPIQLPNSNMDIWTSEIYSKSYYSFMPWSSEIGSFWDTNNLFTTRHRNNAGITIANYNGFHAVSYVPGRGNAGYAAEIRSTANGRGNTKFIGHTEQDYNKVAGELYTGTTKITMGGNDADGSKDVYERIKDSEHPSRPTSLHFYYKYAPYNTDTWKVHIELLDENKNVIIQNDFQSPNAASDWTEGKLELEYDSNTVYAKCKYIFIIFYSTINSGKNMPYREITQTFYIDNATKTFSPAYVGSILTIDDISLVYDK